MLLKSFAFSCTHWALGSLVLIGLAASEFSGAGTVVALPIACFVVSLSVLCGASESTKIVSRKRKIGDVADFLKIWFDIIEHLASAATCARVASATVDYTSDGRLRDWLFGLESHSLGEPWPDVLGVLIIIVVTCLFMLGLEKSLPFSILLYFGVLASLLFFIVVGGYHTDIIFWNWTEDFMLRNWSCILTTAAMCSFAFANTFPGVGSNKRYIKFTVFTVIPLISYTVVALVFTLMSHYRELAGTAIPLIRVFEVRDVDWARPIMAVGTICVVCVALTEIIPSLYELVLKLAGHEWQVLVLSLLYQNSLTGAPVLAIFTAGSLTSILAFACPLSYLVRLLNAAPLLKLVMRSIVILYNRFKPEFPNNECSVYHTNIHYSKLNRGPVKMPKTSAHKIKSVFDVLPRYLRQSSSASNVADKKPLKNKKVPSDDKEYLLLGDYNECIENTQVNGDEDSSESEIDVGATCSDGGEDSSSSTDIDAVVQEYRDRVHVATVNSYSEKKSPTVLSSRIVIICIFFLVISSAALACGITFDIKYLGWSALIILILLTVSIHLMPQNLLDKPKNEMLPKSLLPFCAILSITLSIVLVSTLLTEIWPGILFWTCGGLILFWRCDCCNCEGLYTADRERQKLQPSRRDCYAHGMSHFKNKHVDTILIAR